VTDTTETNRRLLRALFSTIASEGWADGFMAALHDDLVFNAMGTSPVAGRYQGKQVSIERRSWTASMCHCGRMCGKPQSSLLKDETESGR
jgi:ketosteroid isomerase-like protein